MKNYLLLLRNLLKKESNTIKEEVKEDNLDKEPMIDNSITEFINKTGLKYAEFKLPSINKSYTNAFEMTDNRVFFYPPNDGMPRCAFEYYHDKSFVLDNCDAFIQISNLDEILLQMTKIISLSLDEYIIINPYSFMLELTGNINRVYHGPANLVITNKTIKNSLIHEDHFDDARKFFINIFLDHFIGWNFGVSVNRNKKLKEELEKLNDKVIELGIREDAGPGFEVYGTVDKVNHGLQHYNFKKQSVGKKLVK